MKKALTIAGSDSSGGAGIQADLKTFLAHDVYGMSVITALTAQNTTGVTDIVEVTPNFVKAQMDAVFTDIRPDAVKIGMVANPDIIRAIVDKLTSYQANKIVVDPVMIATSGSKLILDDAIILLKTLLIPLATVITPNLPEAEVLLGESIPNYAAQKDAAEHLSKELGVSVLIKSGHSKTRADDVLFAEGELKVFPGEKIQNNNTHGTGCTLSSAIAANLAKNMDLVKAIQLAKSYITACLKAQLDLGRGSGPLNHGCRLEQK